MTMSAIIDYWTKMPGSLPDEVSISKIKSLVVFHRQLLMYLDALQDQMIASRSTLLQLSTRYDASIAELKISCRAKTAVSVDQVYVSLYISKFISTATLYHFGIAMDKLVGRIIFTFIPTRAD